MLHKRFWNCGFFKVRLFCFFALWTTIVKTHIFKDLYFSRNIFKFAPNNLLTDFDQFSTTLITRFVAFNITDNLFYRNTTKFFGKQFFRFSIMTLYSYFKWGYLIALCCFNFTFVEQTKLIIIYSTLTRRTKELLFKISKLLVKQFDLFRKLFRLSIALSQRNI